jgi:DNA-binding response OmpR family regulator
MSRSSDPSPPTQAPRILVVDDEEAILFALHDYLTARGYLVDCERDVRAATMRIDSADYALVITDLHLTRTGGNEGLAVIGYVRQHQPAARTVLLTAYGTPEIEVEARQLGADVILNKAVPLREVASVVCTLLGGAASD